MQGIFRITEDTLEPAYLKTLYDLIEECNCKHNTELKDEYDKDWRKNIKVRFINVYGSATMVGWLLIRMQRYAYKIKELNDLLSGL